VIFQGTKNRYLTYIRRLHRLQMPTVQVQYLQDGFILTKDQDMKFSNIDDYLRAFTEDRSLAIMPVPMAAEYFEITSSGIVGRVRSGALTGIKIGKTNYVTMGSVMQAVAERDRNVDIVKAFLEQQARAGIKSVDYTSVMDLLGLKPSLSADRTKIGWVLGYVSRRSWEEKKVLLSVIVHIKGTNHPSLNGFFYLVENICPDWESEYDDRNAFIKAETKRVMKAYRKKD